MCKGREVDGFDIPRGTYCECKVQGLCPGIDIHQQTKRLLLCFGRRWEGRLLVNMGGDYRTSLGTIVCVCWTQISFAGSHAFAQIFPDELIYP